MVGDSVTRIPVFVVALAFWIVGGEGGVTVNVAELVASCDLPSMTAMYTVAVPVKDGDGLTETRPF